MIPMTRRQLMLSLGAAAVTRAAENDWSKLAAEAVGYLRDYIRIDSSNPPGDVAPAAAYLASVLQKQGISSELLPSDPPRKVNLARLRGNGRKRPLLLLNHTDTVPADRSRWKSDPFGAEIRDGRLWGRGAVDMKSTGIAHLMTMLLLARDRVPLARDVVFAATADEEIGGDLGVGFLLKKHAEKMEAEYVLEEGGFSATGLFTAEGEVHGVSVAQKQVLWLHLSVEGTGGHGSQPADDNAIAALSRALRRIVETPPPKLAEPVLDQMLSRLAPAALANNRFASATQRNTISLTSFRAGVGEPPKDNVVPSLATASIDCRLLPGQSVDDFIAWLRRTAAEPKLKIEIVHHQPSAAPSRTDTELFRAIESAAKRHSPSARVIPISRPSAPTETTSAAPTARCTGFSRC